MTKIYITSDVIVDKNWYNVVIGDKDMPSSDLFIKDGNLLHENWKNICSLLEYNSYTYNINICGNASDKIKRTLTWYLTYWMFYNTPFETNFVESETDPVIQKLLINASKKIHEHDW